MDAFLKVTAAVLILIMLLGTIGKKEASLVFAGVLGCCTVIGILCIQFLMEVTDFIRQLISIGSVPSEAVSVMLKITGIGMITQIVVPICSDSGHSSLGKSLKILSAVVILYLSIPVFNRFLELMQTILGKVS